MATRDQFTQKLLEIAAGEVGQRELGGPNWGPRVKEYLAAVRITFPAAWCAAYDRWCLVKTCQALGVQEEALPILTEFSARSFASCTVLGAYAREEGILYKIPRPGDLFLVPGSYPGRFRHTGIVATVQSDSFVGYEGNTNNDGSSEGYGVFRRTRTIRPGYRFIRFLDHLQPHGVTVGAGDAEFALFTAAGQVAEMPVVEGRAVVPIRAFAEKVLKIQPAQIVWDAIEKGVILNGQPVETPLFMLNGTNHGSIRALAAEFDLTLTVDTVQRRVTVAPEAA